MVAILDITLNRISVRCRYHMYDRKLRFSLFLHFVIAKWNLFKRNAYNHEGY